MELYKKHRPKSLDRVVGNADTVAALRAMLDKQTLPHTLLFSGPSGCGKTTLARIVVKELQCGDLDYIEVNSSSFRGIDTIREIQRTMYLSPTNGPCRVWLLDEAHQLSTDAQNAALKMLEDTPTHVYFIICTTNPQKIIATIRNRATEFPVEGLKYDELEGLIKRVAAKEKITLHEDAVDAIAANALGSPRMALVLLEKIANLAPAKQGAAIAAQAAAENEAIDLCRALIDKKGWGTVAAILKNMKDGDAEQIRWAVLGYARQVLISKSEPNHQAYLIITCFQNNFYDSKNSGLAAACFEATFGEK